MLAVRLTTIRNQQPYRLLLQAGPQSATLPLPDGKMKCEGTKFSGLPNTNELNIHLCMFVAVTVS